MLCLQFVLLLANTSSPSNKIDSKLCQPQGYVEVMFVMKLAIGCSLEGIHISFQMHAILTTELLVSQVASLFGLQWMVFNFHTSVDPDVGTFGNSLAQPYSVFVAEYGQKQPPWFCFMPSYWRPQASKVGNSEVSLSSDTVYDEDIEPISANLKGKDVIRYCMLNIRIPY